MNVTDKLVAEIRQLYGHRHEEKLQIQKDMVALRDEHKWSNHRIAEETGIPRATVINWLAAADEGGSRLTPSEQQTASDRRVARRVLKEAKPEEVEELVADLPDEALDALSEKVTEQRVARKVYPEQIKPQVADANRRNKAKIAERDQENPVHGATRIGVRVGQVRAEVRVLVREYEEFLALVDDEEIREAVRDEIIELAASVQVALTEAVEGSIESAFAKLLDKEVQK